MENKFGINAPEQVIIYPNTRIIEINNSQAFRAYGLFDTATGTQVSDFVKGDKEQIKFDNLDIDKHYDVGVIEDLGDEKPHFAINWTNGMRDDTEKILSNSDNLPVAFPQIYLIKDKNNNTDNVFDLVDDQGDTVGQVIKLAPQGDKPRFVQVHTFNMKDDTAQ